MFRSAAVVTALTLCACKGSSKPGADPAATSAPGGSTATPSTPAPSTPAPPVTGPPFTGALTPDRVLSARGLLDGALPRWDVALARVEHHLGKATRVDGDRHLWAAREGDRCAYTYLQRQDGRASGVDHDLGSMMAPMAVTPDGPVGNRRECLAILGITPGPPEDPAAPGPPADTTPVTVEAFRSAAVLARSRWTGQNVAVVGALGATSTSTSNGARFATVAIKSAAADGDRPVRCHLPPSGKLPALAAGGAVIATGTVRIAEWTTLGSGETTVEAVLDGCIVEAAPRPPRR